MSLTLHTRVHVDRQTWSRSSRTRLQQRTRCCDVGICRQVVAAQTGCSMLHRWRRMIQRTRPAYHIDCWRRHEPPPLDSAAELAAANSRRADSTSISHWRHSQFQQYRHSTAISLNMSLKKLNKMRNRIN